MDLNVFTFRKADIDDIPLITENRINFMLEILGDKTSEEIDNLRMELHSYFLRTIPTGEFICFIAENELEAVSFGALVIQSIPPSFNIINGSIAYILNMYTKKAYRGMGLCNNMMDLIIDTAKALKVKKLYLNATEDGYGIYKKKGFHSPVWKELELKL